MNKIHLSKSSWVYKFATMKFTMFRNEPHLDDTCSLFNACMGTIWKMFLTFVCWLNVATFLFVTVGGTALFLYEADLWITNPSLLHYVTSYYESIKAFVGGVMDNVGPAFGLPTIMGMFVVLGAAQGVILGATMVITSPLWFVGIIVGVVYMHYKDIRENKHNAHILALFEQYKDGIDGKMSFVQWLRTAHAYDSFSDEDLISIFHKWWYKEGFLQSIGVIASKSPSTLSVVAAIVEAKTEKICLPIQLVD